jgi:dihydrofolate reductase
MKLALIVAMDQNRGIGKDNDLMWHLPAEMRFFTETTKGQIVVMGRKNYDSIPLKYRPLPNRENVILSRNTGFDAGDCKVFTSIDDCLDHFSNETERTVFIIGGGQIYNQAINHPSLEEMYITEIHHSFDPDTFFPLFDETKWKKESIFKHEVNEKNSHSFEVFRYTRI